MASVRTAAGLAVRVAPIRLQTRHPFRIARGGDGEFQNVIVALSWNGLTGYGEAASSTYFGENVGTVLAALAAWKPLLEQPDATPFDLERLLDACTARLHKNPAAHAAVDAALHDLLGKALGAPIRDVLGFRGLPHADTSLTIGIDTPEVMARKVEEAAGWRALKIKVGFPGDVEVVQEIRRRTSQVLRVDANEGWTPRRAVAAGRELARLGVEMIEQPVAAHDLEGLRFVRGRVDVPIYADESVETAADVPRLAGVLDGVNLKLAKTGGIREMLRAIHTARAHGLGVMLGCMVETSAGVTAAAALACHADLLDLDGSSLIARDPMRGMTVDKGAITLPAAPGLGLFPADPDLGRALADETSAAAR